MYQQYVDLGISVIPIAPLTKKPFSDRLKEVGWHNAAGEGVWRPAMQKIADPEILKQWFGDGKASIALIAGKVSKNLVYLDWDSGLAYKQWAMAHVNEINKTAVSKTASGYHVFFRLPGSEGGRTLYYNDKAAGQIRGEGQYVVEEPSVHPTGYKYKWLRHPSEGIMELESLDQVHIKLLVKTQLPDRIDTAPVSYSDGVLLIRAKSSWWGADKFNRLWAGNWGGYNSRSEGHLALCRQLAYWTGRDVTRVDRLFRQSAFYTADENAREKWHRKSNAQGMTYGEMTVDLACRSCNKVYEVRRKGQGTWQQI